jgi:hypothetical protein
MQMAVTFTSERFRPVLPEDCQVNPGRYGAELAFWLCAELAREGVVTSYPNYEDWGWFVEYSTDEDDVFWLCCGNVEGTDREWHCFLQPMARGILRRSKPRMEQAVPVMDALARALAAEPSIDDVRWSEEQ